MVIGAFTVACSVRRATPTVLDGAGALSCVRTRPYNGLRDTIMAMYLSLLA